MAHVSHTITPLTAVQHGKQVRIITVAVQHRTAHRLAELGLIPGSETHIIQGHGRGPLLLALGNTRLAVERCVADDIMVQPTYHERTQPMMAHQASI